MRVFLTVSALGLVILSLTMSFLIQRTDLFWSDEDKDKIFFKLVNSKNPMTDYFWRTENTKRLVYKINH